MVKPKVGFYGVTGCAGCLLSVVFNEDEILDIVNAVDIVAFPLLKQKNPEVKLDICFIEGTVVSNDDLETIKKLRKRSKVVVALGTCACQGNIPAMRNFANADELEYLRYKKKKQIKGIGKPAPLHKFIKIEHSLPGCPPNREEIKKFIKEILIGKTFRDYPDPVCMECKLFENSCLLDNDKVCLGPLTRGGCEAVCPTNGLACYGCRGVTDDANFEEYFKLLSDKEISVTKIKKRMEVFVGLEVNYKLRGIKWEQLL
ncbi:MAG: hypothetical protein U9O94_02075 [Nanoarchaeota archaeon]|nr:hypothetical protein [Nanoarchaeota archaeon]